MRRSPSAMRRKRFVLEVELLEDRNAPTPAASGDAFAQSAPPLSCPA